MWLLFPNKTPFVQVTCKLKAKKKKTQRNNHYVKRLKSRYKKGKTTVTKITGCLTTDLFIISGKIYMYH